MTFESKVELMNEEAMQEMEEARQAAKEITAEEVEQPKATEKKERKFTKKEYFTMIDKVIELSAAPNKEELRIFVAKQIELLDNKKATDNPKDKENARIKDRILTVLSCAAVPMTISELLKEDLLKTYQDGDKVAEMTNQKLSYLLNQMAKVDGTIVRTENKKKAYFSIKAAN